jgi:exopolysaccharide production protein ExoZ
LRLNVLIALNLLFKEMALIELFSKPGVHTPDPVGRLEYIDALRGVAILGVIMIHCGQRANGMSPFIVNMTAFGGSGVSLFFMLSALTLCTIYFDKPFAVGDFYIRRYFRIAPAFYVAAIYYVLTDGIGPSLYAPFGLQWRHFILTGTFLHGWSPDTVNSTVPGGWSIGAEAMFYLIFPLCLRFFDSLLKAVLGLVASFALAPAWALLIKTLLSQYEPQYLIDVLLFFGFVQNLSAFMFGIILFYIFRTGSVFLSNVPARRLHGGFVVLAGLLLLASLRVPVVSSRPVVLVLLAALVVGVRSWGRSGVAGLIFRSLGQISFSLYLIHFTVLEHIAVPMLGAVSENAYLQFAVLMTTTLGLSAIFATLTYYAIEQPGIRLGRWMIETRRRTSDRGRPSFG